MNIVDYAIRFKDMASAPLNKFTERVQKSMPVTTRFATHIAKMTTLHKKSYNELQAEIKRTEDIIRNSRIKSEIRDAQKQLRKLQNEASKRNIDGGGSGKGGGLSVAGMLKGGLAIGAVMAVGREVGQFLGSSIQDGLERQQVQTSFNVLAGSKEKGSALTDQLVQLQKDTILGKEVFKNAQTMMGFGFDSTEIIENMKMLGDVSMGDADKFNSLTLAFSQIRAAGKLQGQDLLQLINAGFNPLEQMAKRTGKSIGELKEEMGKGNISFADVQQAFKDATSEGGKFNNMLEQIAQTPAGKMKQLEGAWGEFKIKAGTAFMPLVSMGLDLANKILPKLELCIDPISQAVATVIGMIETAKPYLVEMIQPAVEFFKQIVADTSGWMEYIDIVKNLFVEHIYPVIKKVVDAVFSMVGSLINFIANSQMLKDIFSFVGKVVGWIWDMIGGLVDAIKWVWDNIVMPLVKAIDKVYSWIKGKSLGVSTPNVKNAPVTKPVTPEDKEQTQLLTNIATNTKANQQSAAATEKAIAGGGPKVVNITVGKFFDSINFQTTNLQETASNIEQTVLEVLSRVLMQGATAAL